MTGPEVARIVSELLKSHNQAIDHEQYPNVQTSSIKEVKSCSSNYLDLSEVTKSCTPNCKYN